MNKREMAVTYESMCGGSKEFGGLCARRLRPSATQSGEHWCAGHLKKLQTKSAVKQLGAGGQGA